MAKASDTKVTISRRMVWITVVVIVVMFSFGFAMSPLYDVVCRAIGINSKPVRVEAAAGVKVDETRMVTVEFTGNAVAGLPWEFHAMTKKLVVHPGAITTVKYFVKNPTSETITGQAVPSISPALAAESFKKIECFCFTQQKLEAGESREMPVQFYVDPALPSNIQTITLSYGFFNVDKDQAKRLGSDGADVMPASHDDHAHHAGSKS